MPGLFSNVPGKQLSRLDRLLHEHAVAAGEADGSASSGFWGYPGMDPDSLNGVYWRRKRQRIWSGLVIATESLIAVTAVDTVAIQPGGSKPRRFNIATTEYLYAYSPALPGFFPARVAIGSRLIDVESREEMMQVPFRPATAAESEHFINRMELAATDAGRSPIRQCLPDPGQTT